MPHTAPTQASARLHRRLARAAVAILVLAGAALTPFAKQQLPAVPSYMLAFGFGMIITNLLLAGLMFSRGLSERSPSSLRLGNAYWFVSILFFPLIAAFPDAVLPGGSLIGNKLSAVWLWSFWHVGFGALVLRYGLVALAGEKRQASSTVARQRGRSVGRQLVAEVVVSCCAVIVVAWVSTAGLAWLPAIFMGRQGLFGGWGAIAPVAALCIDMSSAIVLARLRRPSNEQVWLGVGMVAACFDVWLTWQGSARFSVGWYFSKLGSLFTTLVVLVSLFVELTALYRRTAELNLVLDTQANLDGLTGLANRRRFDEALATECARAGRARLPVSLLMIDVDLFKRFNDRYGHLAGDDCLRSISAMIAKAVQRPGDLAARYGGEEFAVILPGTAMRGAIVMAERIRRGLEQLALEHADSPNARVTLSIGVAEALTTRSTDAASLIGSADRALYRAKTSGRDRICLHEPPHAPGTGMPGLPPVDAPVAELSSEPLST